jgi:hypothetical protein
VKPIIYIDFIMIKYDRIFSFPKLIQAIRISTINYFIQAFKIKNKLKKIQPYPVAHILINGMCMPQLLSPQAGFTSQARPDALGRYSIAPSG